MATREVCWGLLASQPKQITVSSGRSERLCLEEIKLRATGEKTSILLWLLYIGMGVCACTYVCANTTQGEKKNHKSKSSKEKAYKSESRRTLGMVILCFCSVEPGSVMSPHPLPPTPCQTLMCSATRTPHQALMPRLLFGFSLFRYN